MSDDGLTSQPSKKTAGNKHGTRDWILVFVGAVLFAIIIRTFLFQAFSIPSGSMLPTLPVGDRLIVNKLSYRVHDIRRGDIVVFERPTTPQALSCYRDASVHDFIKRVVGLPGDKIHSEGGIVYINGKALTESYLSKDVDRGDDIAEQTVPKNAVFLMGDNRAVSLDSRCAGPIPEKDIVGRASVVFWPVSHWERL